MRAVDGPVLLLAVPAAEDYRAGQQTGIYDLLSGDPAGIHSDRNLYCGGHEDMRRRFAKIFGEEDAKRLEFRTINGISQKSIAVFAYRTQKTPFQVADKEASTAVKQSFGK